MPLLIQFIFFYVVAPFGAVILFGALIYGLSNRGDESADVDSFDNPLKNPGTWLVLVLLLMFGVFRYFQNAEQMRDLLAEEILSAAYFFSFVILAVSSAIYFSLSHFNKNRRRKTAAPSAGAIILFGLIAVISTFIGSWLISEFFRRASLITH